MNIKSFLVLFLSLICSIASAEIIIDGRVYFPCVSECTEWIYQTPDEGNFYEPKQSDEHKLVEAYFTGGDYKINICGEGANAASDSIYVGIDGEVVATMDLKFWMFNHSRCTSDTLEDKVAIIPISEGDHLVSFWTREDGLKVTGFGIDKI